MIILLKSGCYLKGRLIKIRKYKNRVLSIPEIVLKDYDGGLIHFTPSVTIYDLLANREYFTTSDCITQIDKIQYDNLLEQFKKRKHKKEVSFNLKKKIKNKKKERIIKIYLMIMLINKAIK